MSPAASGRFSMSSEAEDLARLRAWLRETLEGLGVDRATRAELVLAVGELCANSIEHAYDGRGGQPINVSVLGHPDRLVIEVEDFGRAFDAARYVEPDLDTVPDHGLGIHLVHRIADSVAIDVKRDRGTRWTLVKYRPGLRSADGSMDGGTPSSRSGETMDIEVTDSAGITLVAPRGDLDMAAADQMKRALIKLVDDGKRKVLVDLAQVGYVDSSGMGALVASLKHARTLGLGGTSVPARSVAAASPVRPLAGVSTWVVYYGDAPEAARDLARFDVVVLDPHGHPPLPLVKVHGSLVLTYVSLGEVNTRHPGFAAIAGEPWVLSANPSWPDARGLDVGAPAYERWLLDRVVPAALAGPVNGLFLDTADSALERERAEPRRYAGAGQALERVLRELKRRNPRALLLINGGLPLAERLAGVVDGVALESVWTDYDFKAKAYRVRPVDEAESRAALLGRVAALGLPVFTLEYAAADGGPGPAELIRRARARGFVPYVSTIGLDRVSTHTLRP